MFKTEPDFVNDAGTKWWDVSSHFVELYNKYNAIYCKPYGVFATERVGDVRNYLLLSYESDGRATIVNSYTQTEAIYMALEVRLFALKT